MAKYSKEMIHVCAEWVAKNGLMEYGGATLKDFCSAMGIDTQTYYNWLEHSDFSDAIKKAKEAFKDKAEHDIVQSLFKVATGYEYKEIRTEYQDADGRKQPKRQTVTTKQVEPNVGAGIFLLTNIAPERWKNRQRQDVDITTGGDKVAFNGFNFLPYTPEADNDKTDGNPEDKPQAAAGV